MIFAIGQMKFSVKHDTLLAIEAIRVRFNGKFEGRICSHEHRESRSREGPSSVCVAKLMESYSAIRDIASMDEKDISNCNVSAR